MNTIGSLLIEASVIEQMRNDMIRFASLQLRNDSLAEDVVQEVLVVALDNSSAYAGRSELRTWLFAILKNKIVDLIRQQARTTNVSALSAEEESLDQAFESLFKTNAHWLPGARPSNWGDPEESLREQRFWEVFDACLKHLPENTARVFMMREFLEFETAEVCHELGISSNNCNVILYRARNRLRRCLEEKWFSPFEMSF
ncbi:MAG: RNA polymerase subunit sigma [Betaproteobacteria bacterium HGW-Betaproteobacteria-5]|jgi:RNA polymerase sigma-70 factor (ECF subfamily)|nr:MAG: RNA polymerase subunit sigma [Betaproteobacteria bacterium HGW-Betaproteobacteria-5]PKO39158.1 MAG: RNA polymerase subunit sigma [Betaproteobacteria bacterium HGW-Betaproteobacteria-6]